jgi:hypothetical protein
MARSSSAPTSRRRTNSNRSSSRGRRRELRVAQRLVAHAPQVAKQIIAASQPTSRSRLTELVVQQVKGDADLRVRVAEHGIDEIDIRRVLSEIFEKPPIIGLPIDRFGQDLREWAQTLRTEVKLWTVRKLASLSAPLLAAGACP